MGTERVPRARFKLFQLLLIIVGWTWSTVALLSDSSPGSYRVGLGLVASIVLGAVLQDTYRSRPSQR